MTNERQLLPLARTDALVVKELEGEVLVYDLTRDKAHCLNQMAATVWKHCDGKLTVAEVACLLESELAEPVDTEVVWLALQQLDKYHLLQERMMLSQVGQGISRRDLVRRIGIAAALLPVVVSITAPTAASAASCGAAGAQCVNITDCCSNCCQLGMCTATNIC